MLVIAGTIRIDPSKREAAFAAAREITAETRREEGNAAYAFSADLEDEGLVHIFEEWDSQDALDRHFEMPHMAAFQKTLATLGVSEMKVRKYEIASVGSVF